MARTRWPPGREPWPLAQARQTGRHRRWVPREPGPGRQIESKDNHRRQPNGRSGRTQATDPTPAPRQTSGSRAGSTHPHPPCRIGTGLGGLRAGPGTAQISSGRSDSGRPGRGCRCPMVSSRRTEPGGDTTRLPFGDRLSDSLAPFGWLDGVLIAEVVDPWRRLQAGPCPDGLGRVIGTSSLSGFGPPDPESVSQRVSEMGELDRPVVDERYDHGGAELLCPVDRGVHVLDLDVEDRPARRAHF
jgi:hypothetical protein